MSPLFLKIWDDLMKLYDGDIDSYVPWVLKVLNELNVFSIL